MASWDSYIDLLIQSGMFEKGAIFGCEKSKDGQQALKLERWGGSADYNLNAGESELLIKWFVDAAAWIKEPTSLLIHGEKYIVRKADLDFIEGKRFNGPGGVLILKSKSTILAAEYKEGTDVPKALTAASQVIEHLKKNNY